MFTKDNSYFWLRDLKEQKNRVDKTTIKLAFTLNKRVETTSAVDLCVSVSVSAHCTTSLQSHTKWPHKHSHQNWVQTLPQKWNQAEETANKPVHYGRYQNMQRIQILLRTLKPAFRHVSTVNYFSTVSIPNDSDWMWFNEVIKSDKKSSLATQLIHIHEQEEQDGFPPIVLEPSGSSVMLVALMTTTDAELMLHGEVLQCSGPSFDRTFRLLARDCTHITLSARHSGSQSGNVPSEPC